MDIWIFGHLDFGILGNLNIWNFRYLDNWIFSKQLIQLRVLYIFPKEQVNANSDPKSVAQRVDPQTVDPNR